MLKYINNLIDHPMQSVSFLLVYWVTIRMDELMKLRVSHQELSAQSRWIDTRKVNNSLMLDRSGSINAMVDLLTLPEMLKIFRGWLKCQFSPLEVGV